MSAASESFTLDEVPAYAQVGSIIPLLPEPKSSRDRIGRAQRIPESLLLYTLVGGSSRGRGYIYEDDGTTIAYQDSSRSANAVTRFDYTVSGNTLQFSKNFFHNSTRIDRIFFVRHFGSNRIIFNISIYTFI
jgi:hypothetical protein